MYRILACLFLVCALVHAADAQPYPLWDGQESIADYAKRTNLPPTKTLDLGNGVNLELVLIPAGKFVMGTHARYHLVPPGPLDEKPFLQKIVVGKATFTAGIGVLLLLITRVITRAIRQRHRPQYSLAMFMVMMLTASVAVIGGLHWWFSMQALSQAEAEHGRAMADYENSEIHEPPPHEVTITKPYYMAQFEATQEQYIQVMGVNPSQFTGNVRRPVEQASWDDAQTFCKRVGMNAGQTVRLPTEAEWEYACRAGTTTRFCSGHADTDADAVAWYEDNSSNSTHLVGQKRPNVWGIYDMHGNVWEWCQDWWDDPSAAPVTDPQGPSSGIFRVLRGGAWYDFAMFCGSSFRYRYDRPNSRARGNGFRVVVEVPRTP